MNEIALFLCKQTGLTEPELNILIYCFIIPASWYTIVWLRTRKGLIILILHIIAPYIYFTKCDDWQSGSRAFYDKYILAVNWMGATATPWGNAQISLIVGILLPLLFYAALLFGPQNRLKDIYRGIVLWHIIYYGWIWFRI
jgi:hypothetical protein